MIRLQSLKPASLLSQIRVRRPGHVSLDACSAEKSAAPAVAAAGPWGLVALLWVAYVINYTDRQSVFSMFPILKSDLGFSDIQLGLIGSIFIWVYAACTPFAGRLADRYPREKLIVFSMILWSLTMIGLALSSSVESFLSWRALVAVTECVYCPAALALIACWHAGPTRARAISIHCSAPPAGLVIGGWFGGWSAEHIGWRYGFVLLALVGLAYALFLQKSFKHYPSVADQVNSTPSKPWAILRSRCYVAEVMAYFMAMLILWMLYSWLPTLIYERFHLSMAESGLVATVYLQASTVVGVLTGGILGDRLTRRVRQVRFVIVGGALLISCPFSYLLLAAQSLLAFQVWAVFYGFFMGLLIANSWAAAFDVVEPGNYSFAAAFLTLTSGVSSGMGVVLGGYWKDSIVSLAGWSAVVTAASAVVLLWVSFRYYDRDRARIAENLELQRIAVS